MGDRIRWLSREEQDAALLAEIDERDATIAKLRRDLRNAAEGYATLNHPLQACRCKFGESRRTP